MASIGQSLSTPEAGWTRILNTDGNFIYRGGTGAWATSGVYALGKQAVVSSYYGARLLFNFTGTQLRIIGSQSGSGSGDGYVLIDGVGHPLSFNGSVSADCLLFEITGLADKEHTVEMGAALLGNGTTMYFVAVDVGTGKEVRKYDNGVPGFGYTYCGQNVRLLQSNDGAGMSVANHLTGYYGGVLGKQGVNSGKRYFEVKVVSLTYLSVGVANTSLAVIESQYYATDKNIRTLSFDGYKNSAQRDRLSTGTFSAGAVVGIAVDMANGTLEAFVNGVSVGVLFSDLASLGTVFPFVTGTSAIFKLNMGGAPFKYPLPAGYSAWYSVEAVKFPVAPYFDKESFRQFGSVENGSVIRGALATPDTTGAGNGSFVITSGKYYWEVTATGTDYFGVGVTRVESLMAAAVDGTISDGVSIYDQRWLNGSRGPSMGYYLTYYITDKVFGVLLDMDARSMTVLVDGHVIDKWPEGTFSEAGVVFAFCRKYAGDPGRFDARLNLGQTPFTLGLPAGYKAYNTAYTPPVASLNLDRTSLHTGSVVLSGSLESADVTKYRVKVGDRYVYPDNAGSYSSPVAGTNNINLAIPAVEFSIGSNKVAVGYTDSTGIPQEWTATVTRTNVGPAEGAGTDQLNRSARWVDDSVDSVFTVTLTDADGDKVKCKLLVNTAEVLPFGTLQPTPASVSLTIPKNSLNIGSNALQLVVEDEFGASATYDYTLVVENVNTGTVTREYKYSVEYDASGKATMADGVAKLSAVGSGVVVPKVSITTQGRSNIQAVQVTGSEDGAVMASTSNKITTATAVGSRFVFEAPLKNVNDYPDLVVNIV